MVVEEVPQPLGRQSGLISHIVTFKWLWREFHKQSGVSQAGFGLVVTLKWSWRCLHNHSGVSQA